MRFLLLVCSVALTFFAKGQQVSDFINATNIDSLEKIVREFSGEQNCIVNGNSVQIINRQSNTAAGNNLSADYLLERLNSYGLSTEVHNYASKGRNIYATKVGITNPDSLVIIGAHYDAVANYCADDNGSGVAIALEAARILSQYNFANTIVFAFWDEEELGLLGSKMHAQLLSSEGAKIKAVLNIDMAGFDSNDDRVFDIDLNIDSGSDKIKEGLLNIKNAHNLNLFERVVQPGTDASDHSAFWTFGYPAVLLGESWETGDQNSAYHSANDRIALFNMPYFHSIAKLAIGYIGETAVPLSTVSLNGIYSQIEVSIYPNPTSEILQVKSKKVSIINIHTLSGRLVESFYRAEGVTTVDVSGYARGVYNVLVYSTANELVLQQQVVVN